MRNYCEYFNCECEEVTDKKQEEYGEVCLISCEDCEWMEEW